jgi:hypothetical protein
LANLISIRVSNVLLRFLHTWAWAVGKERVSLFILFSKSVEIYQHIFPNFKIISIRLSKKELEFVKASKADHFVDLSIFGKKKIAMNILFYSQNKNIHGYIDCLWVNNIVITICE